MISVIDINGGINGRRHVASGGGVKRLAWRLVSPARIGEIAAAASGENKRRNIAMRQQRHLVESRRIAKKRKRIIHQHRESRRYRRKA